MSFLRSQSDMMNAQNLGASIASIDVSNVNEINNEVTSSANEFNDTIADMKQTYLGEKGALFQAGVEATIGGVGGGLASAKMMVGTIKSSAATFSKAGEGTVLVPGSVFQSTCVGIGVSEGPCTITATFPKENIQQAVICVSVCLVCI